MAKKILITGSGGFVGKYLYSILKPKYLVFGVDKKESIFVNKKIDISDENELVAALYYFGPEIIVHLAAFSNVELCETEKELAYTNNVLPTKILVSWAKDNNTRMIFVSSDYVYDGIKGNFTEKDKENPLNYYGKTKLEAEQIFSSLENYIILRPTVIYGWDPDGINFFMQLYRNQMNGKEMRVPTDQISNPTFVLDLCNLIKKIIGTSNFSGKYIATGKESLNRYEFGAKICDYFGWNKELLVPLQTAELRQVAKRPLNNSTISKKVCRDFDFKFNDFNENFSLIKKQIVSGQFRTICFPKDEIDNRYPIV